MIICVQKEHGGHDPGLTGGSRSTVESPLQHRERLSKSLNKVMDFRQSLQRCAGPTGAGKSSPAEEKWSVCAGVRHAGDEEERGRQPCIHHRSPSEPQRKARKQRQEMLGVSSAFGRSRESPPKKLILAFTSYLCLSDNSSFLR